MKKNELHKGVESLWGSVADGWQRLRQSASGALTRFLPGAGADVPASLPAADAGFGPGWGMVGSEVFEDDDRIVVRLETPGLAKGDFDIRVVGDMLIVRGEKRFERESGEGRWRVLECAYGQFSRSVPLPGAVDGDAAKASYRQGVLRIELPRLASARPRRIEVAVR
jgi:HSP20 family protein